MDAMFWLAAGITAVAAYLLGSINFGIIVCKLLFKQDPRAHGSGNAGMTNVARTFGKKGAVLTLLGDVGKAMLAVWVGRWAMMLLAPDMSTIYCAYIGGIFAIIGHTYPVFFHFKGGKGVASAGGAILALQPLLALVLVAIFLLIFFVGKMVSLSSVIGISLYPVVTYIWYSFFVAGQPVWYCTVCSFIIAAMVVWMHRANIKRIRQGTEYRFGQKKK